MRLHGSWVTFALFLSGCAANSSSDDAGMKAAASHGVPPSPSADLLSQLAKGQPTPSAGDGRVNERNARILPQVMANSDEAVRRVMQGDDAGKVIDDMNRKNSALGVR